MNTPSSLDTTSTEKPTLIRNYVEILLENLGFMARFIGVVLLFGVVVLFLVPRTYTAKVVLMPPEDPNKQNPLMQAAGALGLGSLTNPANATDILAEMLKSNTIADSLIAQEALEEIFLSESERTEKNPLEKRELLRKELSDLTKILTNKAGYITLEVKISTPAFSFSSVDDDSARNRAARIANGYVSVLDRTNRRLANLKSVYNAEYFAEQVAIAKRELDSAYSNFERFQKSNKAIALSEQMKFQMETLSKLKAQMIAEELQLDLLLKDRQPNDMLVLESRSRLNEYRKKYEEATQGKSDKLSLALDEMPTVSREYANNYREVKIHEEVYALLKQLYFKERVQGYRDTPTVVVLDSASVPFYRTSPKRGLMLLVIFVVGFFAAIIAVFIRRWFFRFQSDDDYEPLRLRLKNWKSALLR
ncbi:MAG: GNVR domain-containing protein [Chloroherpetonaceae bacterium]